MQEEEKSFGEMERKITDCTFYSMTLCRMCALGAAISDRLEYFGKAGKP